MTLEGDKYKQAKVSAQIPISYSAFNQLWRQVYRVTSSQKSMQEEIRRLKSGNAQLKYDNDRLIKNMKEQENIEDLNRLKEKQRSSAKRVCVVLSTNYCIFLLLVRSILHS